MCSIICWSQKRIERMNVTEYLAQFNTNPACDGVGPTGLPKQSRRITALTIYLIGIAYAIVTTIWYFHMRKHRRRLLIRSLNPLITGSLGSAGIILIRATYDYIGREKMSCALNIALIYLFFIFNIVPENLTVAAFFVKQQYREQLSLTMFQSNNGQNLPNSKHTRGELQVSESTTSDRQSSIVPASPRRHPIDGSKSMTSGGKDFSTALGFTSNWATAGQWFKGFWNHMLRMIDATRCDSRGKIKFNVKKQFPEKDVGKVSPLRELSYEFLVSNWERIRV